MPDVTVFIGRMQPPHAGHFKVIREALAQSKLLIIVLGSPDAPRIVRNPFTFEERCELIRLGLTKDESARVRITGVNDHAYNDDAWLAEVQNNVNDFLGAAPSNFSVSLIGHSKDHTSYYLKMFPQWGSIEVANFGSINATQVRERIFNEEFYWNNGSNGFDRFLSEFLPADHRQFFEAWERKPHWDELMIEKEFLRRHEKLWEGTPYPVSFQTVDSVVTAAGHLLLIQRRAAPGKGLWALPGGYLDIPKHETLRQAMLRELDEETKIAIPRRVLEKSITREKTFDAPNRSERGRLISQVFRIDLDAVEGNGKIRLPKIKGSDDAVKAKWFPLGEVQQMRSKMFEDHFSIIEDMLDFTVEFKNPTLF